MQNKNSNIMWQAPWGYPESFAVVGGIVLIGLMLQITVGSFDFYLLASPVNVCVLAVFVLLSVILGLRVKKSSFARWLSGTAFSVAIVLALLLLTIIMGITPQMTEAQSLLGFEAMTSNWAFVLVYSLTLLSLGVLIVRKITVFKIKDLPFHLNHIGLWLLLAASGLGYADMQRYIMYVNEGETEWRVYDNDKNIEELPIAITLNDFSVNYYPSRMLIVDSETGIIQKGDASDFEMGERYKAIMAAPEPRTFISDVEVYTRAGDNIKTTIEVNKPLRIGSWTIYQYGYDNAAGNESSYSSFELVYDRWITPVNVGVVLMMLGSVAMIWTGRKKMKGGVKNDVE